MTQEDKQLLLIDLCNRLPWGVNGKVETIDANGKKIKDEGVCNSVFIDEFNTKYICIESAEYELDDFKPYLRTMSSMTFEERSFCLKRGTIGYDENGKIIDVYSFGLEKTMEVIDFLNSHHFDWRGLIKKGLALEAPEGVYNLNNI